jgi:multidrug efflux pump subunit AcrA (membrane-fusion protein)
MAASIATNLTPNQVLATQNVASQMAASSVNTLSTTGFVYVATFDGTNNNKNNLSLSATTQSTNVGVISDLGIEAQKINSNYLLSAATNEKLALNPGMIVSAVIHQGQRTVMEYLLSPVRKVGQEAGRER